jgi:hypothetical protein
MVRTSFDHLNVCEYILFNSHTFRILATIFVATAFGVGTSAFTDRPPHSVDSVHPFHIASQHRWMLGRTIRCSTCKNNLFVDLSDFLRRS